MAESAADLRAGCYRCLQEGLALVDGRVDLPSRQRAFELTLLLLARSKELGLPFEPWADRAKSLAASLPPAAAAPDFLALAGALPPDPAGVDREQTFRRQRREQVRAWLAATGSSAALPEVRMYFALGGACGFSSPDRDAIVAEVSAAAAGVPLLEYALGSCGSSEESWLVQAMEHEPRFDDAAYPLARYRMNRAAVNRPREDPAPLFERARAAFPESAGILYTEASYRRFRREWAKALEGFDGTLRLVPAHHDARLGRTQALSLLARHDEAIAAATSLVDEGRWLVGDAYYWRAWNHFALERLDESERDVEQAKQRMVSTAVFVLSGLIHWRKGRPVEAETQFLRAVRLDANDCDAARYLGGVRAELRQWLPAADALAGAEACREREVAALRATLDELVTHGAPAVVIESQKKGIETSEQQAAEMAYHRGEMLANAGRLVEARTHIERAGRHPALKLKAAALVERLARQP